jgi:hypothetical protein
MRLPGQAPGYPVGTFIFTYGTTVLGMTRDFLLVGVLPQTALGFMPGYYRGPTVGRDRPQAGVHERLHDHGDLRLRVLRVAGDPDPVGKFRCRGDLAYSGQERVWT